MKQKIIKNKKYKLKSGASGVYPAPLLKRKSGAGFTLVELLVVISIIAILATILLVATKTFIDRGKDGSIKANMANLLTQGNIYILGPGNYDDFCTSSSAQAFISEIKKSAGKDAGGADVVTCSCDTGSTCTAPATAWCVNARLKKINILPYPPTYFYWCVDSTGKRIEFTSNNPNKSMCSSSTGGLCADTE